MVRINSFEPIADSHSRILILGSMPGVESLRKKQYYGFGKNSFWRLVFALKDTPFTEDYEERKRFLLRSGIALWDVILSCEREGSSDANIRNVVPNDFDAFFRAHPNIRRVFFNGRKAHDEFAKKIGFRFEGIEFATLGSTSPAHAVSFDTRLDDWRKINEERRQG